MQFSREILQQCWFLAGPTACGKTELSLLLAEHLNAEILAMDSMSLYRGMDIGTAKASAAERERVPHHLLDLIDPHEKYSVADYFTAADECCRQIVARGKTPLFVGGTGLYLRAILRGVFNGPSADWDYRSELEAFAETAGNEALHQRLAAVDPVSAEKYHFNDVRRVARALEVYHVTGVPLSSQHAEDVLTPEECPAHVFWLLPDREWLYDRINLRVDQMLEEGLLDEVKRLLAAEVPMGRTARQALGYKELIDYLEGVWSWERAVEMLKQQTRRFAKRQHTFFRNITECREIDVRPEDSPADLLQKILKYE
ncbi:tRNA (adenosine(37)-N6)-dimethylallyltransferase MiaA [Gimesia sp.]|uniref:tRNA (adenosine(37)-N6)-dimethylallyltransferase MiaA n=1 Tax=Gimesia sp. TaxID=2024833 RepID=UPI000C63E9F0|nr:tRNA (adenosine(37)-N6)-dimethylallyltransferase MiaA [Gimesia sp.]MAX40028.1 tRNA (adenosine(37)-N6)-dimethylallyltransferase MiaA [Gimesia sp.]HBL48314.1 tRNA (adenosine(37)-N6)-dimethylallyltransferase MiaA [Planctomycetaceae bacterium]